MKSVYNFIVTPKGDRYNNKKKIGDKELILNTEIFNHQYVNREAVVISTPMSEYQKIITKITKPSILKDGVTIQAAKVRIQTQERTDAEIADHIRKLKKIVKAEQKFANGIVSNIQKSPK